MAKVLTVFLSVMVLFPAVLGAEGAQSRKQELERLKKQAAQKQQELNKYRAQEKAVSKEISALETRRAEVRREQSKVQSDLSSVEQELLSTSDKQAALERSLPMWQGVLGGELAEYYLQPSCPVCAEDERPEQRLFVERALWRKAQFAGALQNAQKAAVQKISDFEQRNKELQARQNQLAQREQVISTDFRKKQQDLTKTQQKSAALRKEIEELNRSAQALNDLLARFERQRKAEAERAAAAQKSAGKTGNTTVSSIATIDVPAHSLPWPAPGQIISKFGKEYQAELGTWIFRDGIKIAVRPAEPVKCVAPGEVIYAGPFRSYGNVVIVDHGKGFFSIYGFLSKIEVSVGQKLNAGGLLGAAGQDSQASSGKGRYAVYFEIRQGTTAVDPTEWLR